MYVLYCIIPGAFASKTVSSTYAVVCIHYSYYVDVDTLFGFKVYETFILQDSHINKGSSAHPEKG